MYRRLLFDISAYLPFVSLCFPFDCHLVLMC
uniref:Uncharacterized protein n=1 Tax=Arundo donax TaxID=35708 RepID=A0A0A9EL89_ARUDO